MNPMPHRSDLARLRAALVAAAAAVLLAGCVYRLNIQQGNLLEAGDVAQITVGMTRSQVRYVLGTPMISDPFDAQRWDYVYSMRRGRDRHVDRAHFVVHFDGDTVSRVETLDPPDELSAKQSTQQARRDWRFWKRETAPEEDAPPSAAAPPPPAADPNATRTGPGP